MALCHITGTVQLPDGTNAAGRILVFKRNPETVVAQSGHGIIPDEVAVRVASDGSVDFKLYTDNYIGFVRNQRAGNDRVFKFPVPEAATANFQDILQAVDPVEPLPSWLTEAFDARDEAVWAEVAAETAAGRAAQYDGPRFATAQDLLASTSTYSDWAGVKTVRVDSGLFSYDVVPLVALDYHKETAGGVRLRLIPRDGFLHSEAWGITGGGLAGDDTAEFQAMFDAAVAMGAHVMIDKGSDFYHISDDVVVSNAVNMKIVAHEQAEFHTDGLHQGITIYPSIHVGRHRVFICLEDCINTTVTGGIWNGGNSRLAGFQHPGDGRAASAILMLRCVNSHVALTKVIDIRPVGIDGSSIIDTVEGVLVSVRYTAILGIMCVGCTIQYNDVDGAAYSAYEFRIACEDVKIDHNAAMRCGAHMAQCTPGYAQVTPSEFGSDYYCRGVSISYNTGRGNGADITTHFTDGRVIGNTFIDVLTRTMSLRDFTNGVIVAENRFICTSTKGTLAVDKQATAYNVQLVNNTFVNYVKTLNGSGVFESGNVYIDCDDRGASSTVVGRSAGYNNPGTNMAMFGFEAGVLSSGANLAGFGYRALRQNTASEATGVGYAAGQGNSGTRFAAVGFEAGFGNEGNESTFFGAQAGRLNTGLAALLLGDRCGMNNTFSRVVGLAANPTDNNQVQMGQRHFELRNISSSPDAPSSDRGRIYLRTTGGVQRLSVRFGNGTIVDIARDDEPSST